MKLKNKYLFFSVTVIILFGIYSVFSAEKAKSSADIEGKTIVVKEFLMAGLVGADNQIVIAYGNNKTEKIELENLLPKHYSDNTDKLNYVLNKLMDNGYSIVTSSGAGGGQAVFLVTTYVLRKQ